GRLPKRRADQHPAALLPAESTLARRREAGPKTPSHFLRLRPSARRRPRRRNRRRRLPDSLSHAMTTDPHEDSRRQSTPAANFGLARRLGLFDATMIVMGGIIGSGIFVNTSVVARQVHTPFLILGAWLAGGAVALAGAFVYAELAARRPEVGGQYAYLRDAFH